MNRGPDPRCRSLAGPDVVRVERVLPAPVSIATRGPATTSCRILVFGRGRRKPFSLNVSRLRRNLSSQFKCGPRSNWMTEAGGVALWPPGGDHTCKIRLSSPAGKSKFEASENRTVPSVSFSGRRPLRPTGPSGLLVERFDLAPAGVLHRDHLATVTGAVGVDVHQAAAADQPEVVAIEHLDRSRGHRRVRHDFQL